jgi:hypothetical protein
MPPYLYPLSRIFVSELDRLAGTNDHLREFARRVAVA